ncbi:hypothetical protein EDD37DRAFT_444755 [Exophiala viscosa]|uniref:uncharacterized protein n=1 Tax=Exophiala viscosa TaxID=2486360 RepID=UPI0021A1EFD8|nr:hypothetical protein EDD37DRAFT_444755 [Exophiala viscosa]
MGSTGPHVYRELSDMDHGRENCQNFAVSRLLCNVYHWQVSSRRWSRLSRDLAGRITESSTLATLDRNWSVTVIWRYSNWTNGTVDRPPATRFRGLGRRSSVVVLVASMECQMKRGSFGVHDSLSTMSSMTSLITFLEPTLYWATSCHAHHGITTGVVFKLSMGERRNGCRSQCHKVYSAAGFNFCIWHLDQSSLVEQSLSITFIILGEIKSKSAISGSIVTLIDLIDSSVPSWRRHQGFMNGSGRE